MAEHDDWTAADDARLRAALTSLRTDVEAAPLPDVRFVKARGMARRRRRFLTAGAAAAAAAVVAGTVGYDALGPDGDVVHLPAARTSTTTSAAPSPTTATSLDQPGILPLASEWESTLDLPADSVRLVQAKQLEGGVECADQLGVPTLQQSLTQASSPISAAATYWDTGSDTTKLAALEQSVAKCQAGPGFTVRAEHVGDYSLYSYSAKDAGSGWFAVVSGGQGVELLQLIDPAFPDVASGGFTKDELGALAAVARTRLDRYAGGGSSSPTALPTGSSARTVSTEKMTVTGPDPVPSWKLFVPASRWKDPLLAKGAGTTSGPGALEGSTAIVACEDDTEQAGIAGRVGVVSIRIGTGTQSYVGNQRVRIFDDVQAGALVAADLARTDDLVMKGCQTPGGARTTAVAGPTKGTYLLTTKAGGQTLRQWVGVTAMRTSGGVSTVTFHSAQGGAGFQGSVEQGFTLLTRLLAQASQR